MQMLNVEILKLAREARYITQNELAGLLGIEQGTISKIEKEILTADEKLIKKIAAVLDFPISFLCQDRKVISVEGHYRRKMYTPVKKMKQHIAQMTITEWHFSSLIDEIELPETKLPHWDVINDGSPALCAKFLREFWKIPKGRITNLTKLIEDHGIVVLILDLDEMDGFSTYFNGNIPVIFINKNLSPDRFRLTLAHELGHLIMHFGNKISPERDLEAEAFELAIELLVPENNIRPYLTGLSIEKLADLKSYWYVSMQALLRYANTLGMVTSNQYRYLWMQMGSLGYRKKEPVNIPAEAPGILTEILNAYLTELGYSKQELATVMQMNLSQMEQTYFGGKTKLKIVSKTG
ncbi:MAG: XRE family transcriptional regulator [Sediminibacterium sp.]|nr:XRE family transcriptional regulator [Sediminibacterium sp.]MDP3127669.1 XRE family transcriptional regulator [Sediminibacterium sp.]